MAKAKLIFEVIGSSKRFKKAPLGIYKMIDQGNGRVKFGSEIFNLLNIQIIEQHKRNKNANVIKRSGTVGSLLFGGPALAASSTVIKNTKDNSIYIISLQNPDTFETIDIQAKAISSGKTSELIKQYSYYTD